MPLISQFFGIIVTMYMEKGGQHHLPHIHARSGGDEVVIALNGKILEGKLPVGKMRMLRVWMDIHKDELSTCWHLLQETGEIIRIDPLR